MTRLSLENILTFSTMDTWSKKFSYKICGMIKIPLIIYGENPAEYGNRHENITENMNKSGLHVLIQIKFL